MSPTAVSSMSMDDVVAATMSRRDTATPVSACGTTTGSIFDTTAHSNSQAFVKQALDVIPVHLAARDIAAFDSKGQPAPKPDDMDHLNGHLNGSNGIGDLRINDPLADVEKRLKQFRGIDAQREDLVLSLVQELRLQRDNITRLQDDHENERESRQTWQKKARELEQICYRLKQQTETGGFVVAIIDGDGAPFLDTLIQAKGETGGEEAAHKLKEAMTKHIESSGDIPAGCQLVVKIYANFSGLADTLQKMGIISTPGALTSFFRGFSHGQHLFDFVDVGPGKERADFKLKENFDLYLGNAQCKHIFLGGICHDNGYLNMLMPYGRNVNVTSRVTLLQTYDRVQQAYKTSGFDIIRVPDVFRQQELESPRAGFARPIVAASASAVNDDKGPNGNYSMSWRSPTPPSDRTALAPPPGFERSTNGTPAGPASATTNHNNKNSHPGKGLIIYLNRDKCRLDPPLHPPVTEAARRNVKDRLNNEGRLCNKYHLLDNCKDYNCHYVHGERLRGAELSVLASQARTTPCQYAGKCRMFGCTQGHHCPLKVCVYGSECKFRPEQQRDAMSVVAEIRQYENDVFQAVNLTMD